MAEGSAAQRMAGRWAAATDIMGEETAAVCRGLLEGEKMFLTPRFFPPKLNQRLVIQVVFHLLKPASPVTLSHGKQTFLSMRFSPLCFFVSI